MSSLPIFFQRDRSLQDRIDHAIALLKSLRDAETGFTQLIGIGSAALPSLRAILFQRDPSGLYQIRCRAAEVLAALKGFDILADFLRMTRTIDDPTERLGEEAVISAASRSIARLRQEWVYELLADIARRRTLAGVLAGLGAFRRKETIPIFIKALAEDDVRPTAETILLGFGDVARRPLIIAALDRGKGDSSESESSLRKRRSALALLVELNISHRDWSTLCELMEDRDNQIALLTCAICMGIGRAQELRRAQSCLCELKDKVHWFDRERVNQMLHTLQCKIAKEEAKC